MKKLLLVSCLDVFLSKNDDMFRELSGREVLCIPTAAYGEDTHDWLEGEVASLKNVSSSFEMFDVAGKSYEDVVSAMEGKDIVYITGGNTYYLLEHLKKCNFAKALEKHLQNGGWYVGSSAGAVVTCPDIGFIRDRNDPSKADLSKYNGIGLVDFLILPHVGSDDYGEIAVAILESLEGKNHTIIGLHDDQGIVVKGNYVEFGR